MNSQNHTPKINWKLNSDEPLLNNLKSTYKKFIDSKEIQLAEHSKEEVNHLLEILDSQKGIRICEQIQELKLEELFAKNISLWVEAPQVQELETELAEAAVEIESWFLLQKDAIQCEILRKS